MGSGIIYTKPKDTQCHVFLSFPVTTFFKTLQLYDIGYRSFFDVFIQ